MELLLDQLDQRITALLNRQQEMREEINRLRQENERLNIRVEQECIALKRESTERLRMEQELISLQKDQADSDPLAEIRERVSSLIERLEEDAK